MDAHENEYAAAVAGMAETYGATPRRLPAVGEQVHGVAGGKRFASEALKVSEHQVTVGVDMAWIILDPSDLELD